MHVTFLPHGSQGKVVIFNIVTPETGDDDCHFRDVLKIKDLDAAPLAENMAETCSWKDFFSYSSWHTMRLDVITVNLHPRGLFFLSSCLTWKKSDQNPEGEQTLALLHNVCVLPLFIYLNVEDVWNFSGKTLFPVKLIQPHLSIKFLFLTYCIEEVHRVLWSLCVDIKAPILNFLLLSAKPIASPAVLLTISSVTPCESQ